MIDTKALLLTVYLLGISCGQYHPLTMHHIPSKIHYEIFGSAAGGASLPPGDLSTVKHYQINPIFSHKGPVNNGIRTSLTYNSVAYGFGHYQMPLSTANTTTTGRIPLATELFAPAVIKFPAATKGQIEAYMKALEEEAKEEEKERQKALGIVVNDNVKEQSEKIEPKAVSYVNVKLGGVQNVNYHYSAI